MKKGKGSILLLVLICIGILGAMLIMFLDTTTPRRVFYNNAVRSYGFLDSSQNLHGLLELESESLKNLILAQIKNEHRLMFRCTLTIWDEDRLIELKNIFNRSQKEYWERAEGSVVKDIWELSKESESEKSDYDKKRRMLQGSSAIRNFSCWWSYKDQEERIVKDILTLSFDIIKKDFASQKDTLKSILEQLKTIDSNLSHFPKNYESMEIKEIRKILSDVWKNKNEPWEKQLRETEYAEKAIRLMAKLKPPQKERLGELVSLKKIEQRLDGKTSIDPTTWQEIKDLLDIEKSLPQVDQAKKDFLEELEQKFLSSNRQTQLQTFEEVDRIRNEILKIFRNSIGNVLKQENFENSGPQNNTLSLKQLEEDVVGLVQNQSGLFPNRSVDLFSEEKLSNGLQDTLNSIKQDLIDKLKSLAKAYEDRISDKNYQDLRKLRYLEKNLELDNDKNELQSIAHVLFYPKEKLTYGLSQHYDGYVIDLHEKNFNVENYINIHMLDNKLPLTVKFVMEIREAIRLIFEEFKIPETEIKPFLEDLMLVISNLHEPCKSQNKMENESERKKWHELSWQNLKDYALEFLDITVGFVDKFVDNAKEFINNLVERRTPKISTGQTESQSARQFMEELKYFYTIIEDFRDTKSNLDVSIFKEFSSWKRIFKDNKNSNVEDIILSKIGDSLTFASGIDSINFYAANKYVRLALLHTLPRRSEIKTLSKKMAGLPSSKDSKVIEEEMRKTLNYGLEKGNNDSSMLKNNKEIIQERLKLLHEAELVNFPVTQDGSLDVFSSYSKAIEIVVYVWDKDYKVPLHRTTNYHCGIEYTENGKENDNNIVQTVEEF
ncbi:MAG: hypothetical protein LBB17_00130 [Puniceicoccales bacterium]|jgi:DNA-directed RNA polymerase subunit F|nr:hypothetical protein [Puniceicoccales bacterium]